MASSKNTDGLPQFEPTLVQTVSICRATLRVDPWRPEGVLLAQAIASRGGSAIEAAAPPGTEQPSRFFLSGSGADGGAAPLANPPRRRPWGAAGRCAHSELANGQRP